MQIIVNQGANVPAKAIAHYGIAVAPNHIVVDGAEHSTDEEMPFATLDEWVSTAREFPYVVGTSAHAFVQQLADLAKVDPEILVITASRSLIQTYQAATAAARTMQSRAAYANVKIAVVDSGLVDVGVSMLAVVAGEAKLAGLSLRKTVTLVEMLAARARFSGTVKTLDNLVRGGRAGFLRAWLADFLEIKPILSIVNGELKSTGKIKKSQNPLRAIAEDLTVVGAGKRVWAAVAHGDAEDRGQEMLLELRRAFDVTYAYVTPLNPSVYLHAGRGSVFAAVFPIDNLPWELPAPPEF